MKFEDLRRDLAAGRILGAYLVVGSEALLRDDALHAIRGAVLGSGPSDFNLDRLDGARATPAQLVDAVRSLPVMAPRRLVVLRDPEGRGAGGGRLGEVLKEILPELAQGSESTLVVSAERVDGRSAWVKLFDERGRIECDAPTRHAELVEFVTAEAARQQVELGRGAADLLADRVGPQLLLLRQEIAKASLLAGPGRPVTRADVAASATNVAEEPVWDLADALGEGRAADALGQVRRLLATGSAPQALLGALVSHFRRLLALRSGGSIAAPPFVRRKLETQARRYSEQRLVACLRAIHQADLGLKGAGGARPELVLDRLLLGLAA